MRIDGALDMFNALNSNVVLSQNQNYGSTLGQPQAVLQGRLLQAIGADQVLARFPFRCRAILASVGSPVLGARFWVLGSWFGSATA